MTDEFCRNKISYNTINEAKLVAASYRNKFKLGQKPYRCWVCNNFHLYTMGKGKKQRKQNYDTETDSYFE